MTATSGRAEAEPFSVRLPDGQSVTALLYAATAQATAGPGADTAFIVAHGAGAGQHSTFMTAFARAMAERGVDAITFDFPYTEQGRRLPDRAPALEACYAAVVAETRRRVASAGRALFIGGKSMGGRIATHLAAADAHQPLAGLVLLGYPLHPPGRPEQRRDAHLSRIARPMLIVQGSRDPFGTPGELEPIAAALAPPATLHVVDGGDHSYTLRRSAAQQQPALDETIRNIVARWIHERARPGASSPP